MAAFTTIAAVVGATAAVATAASAVSSANAQKKAAARAAATEEENARRAEENAEAWAEAIEQQTKFNYDEALLDAGIVKDRTERDVAFLTSVAGSKEGTYQRELGTQAALLALRGDALIRDSEDEIAALVGQAGFERGALGRRAEETLRAASSAVLSARTRAGIEAASAETQAEELDAQSAAALRRAGVQAAVGAAEQLRLRSEGERIVGAVRAQAAKAGVALSGSAADVMADQAGMAEMQALAAKYQNDIVVDGYVEDARGKSVRAVQMRADANSVRMLTEIDATETLTAAQFKAAELTAEADNTARRTGLAVSQLLSRRDDNLGALWLEGANRVGALEDERKLTAAQIASQITTTKLTGEQQEAAFRREAEQIQKKGEIDARNTRLTQMAMAADFRSSAASRRESGGAAQTAGYLSAGAALLKAGTDIYRIWGPQPAATAASTPSVWSAKPGGVEYEGGVV